MQFDAANLLDEFRTDEEYRRIAVLDDKGDLQTRQSPVHRRHHHIGLHRAKQEFEINVAVLAQIGDALARADSKRVKAVGNAVGMNIERGVTDPAAFEFECDGIAACFCVARTISARSAGSSETDTVLLNVCCIADESNTTGILQHNSNRLYRSG